MTRRRIRRRGFTLLEVVIATAVAAILVGALYVAVDLQLRYAQMSRDTIQDSTLERAIMARMDADAAQVVGLSDPARYRFQAGLDTVQSASSTTPGGATSSTTSANAASSSTTSASSTTSTSGTTSTSSFGSTSSTTNSSSGVSNIVLPLGVMGDSQTLHLFLSNLPREVYGPNGAFGPNAGAVPPVSDIRRVSYWLVSGADGAGGLARQEVPLATSDDALQNLPPGVDNETSFILADEVRDLSFQYWDGTEWNDSWDSTTLGPDGVTPIGSPLAIAVNVQVALQKSSPSDEEQLRSFRHVLVIPSANGMTLQAAAASGTSTQQTTTSSGTNANSTTNGGGASP